MWIDLAIGVLKGLSFVYDAITYLPYYIYQRPDLRTLRSDRIKALPLDADPGSPYRSVESFQQLTTTPFPECRTLDELFSRAVRLYQDNNCVANREQLSEEDEVQPNGKVFKKGIYGDYHWLSYNDVDEKMTNFGRGLLTLGQQPYHNICIFSETRAEWMVSVLTCFRSTFPVVTLYATLGEDAIIHGINESEVTIVITSHELVPKFKKILPKMPKLRHIIYMDNGRPIDTADFPDSINVSTMSSITAIGAKNSSLAITSPVSDDIAVIMYTSGSTGLPKGVLISHGNLMCGMSGQKERIPNIGPGDIYIGYLPMAHVLELSAEMTCVTHGVRIGYSSPQTLSDQSSKIKKGSKGDATVLRPTLMAAVPVIMDRLYKNVWEKVNEGGAFQREVFKFAYEYKKKHYERGFNTPLINKLIFRKVQKLMGGRVRLMLSGGAPLSTDTQRFMNVCFCCPVGQGYGLTETCGAGTIHEATDMSTGRVGAPLKCNDIKLVSWAEGGYMITDRPFPRGEVLLGGGNVTLGYFKDPAKTREEFTESDGKRWFSTGDIGEIHPDGCLKIIDRRKDLVKLQAGEYVSLAKVETVLKMSPLIDNCCVYAESSQMYTVCLVVPNLRQLKVLAEGNGLDLTRWESVCKNAAVESAIMEAILVQAKKAKLERFEIPQRIKICPESWTPDSGLVTDAFKLRRRNIEMHYKTDISRMYA